MHWYFPLKVRRRGFHGYEDVYFLKARYQATWEPKDAALSAHHGRKRNTSPMPLPARRSSGSLSSIVFRLWDLFIPRNHVGAHPLLANVFTSLGPIP